MMVVINYVTTGGHGGYGVINVTMYAQQSPSISEVEFCQAPAPPNLRGPPLRTLVSYM